MKVSVLYSKDIMQITAVSKASVAKAATMR